jgi:hypothetical protein
MSNVDAQPFPSPAQPAAPKAPKTAPVTEPAAE